MDNNLKLLIDRLEAERCLEKNEYKMLIEGFSEEPAAYAASKADRIRQSIYGKDVYIRGLIEVSNICANDCLYCGIRKSNAQCARYRLPLETVLECCRKGYELGLRTFVMQGQKHTDTGYFR